MSDLASQDWQHCPTCDGMCFTEGGLCDNCRGFGQVPVDYTEHVDLGVGSVDDVIAMLRSQRDRAEEHLYAARQRIAELEKAIREHQIEVMYEDITIDADRHLWAMLDGREVRLPTRGEGSS